jgi:peroxiredoxin
MAQLRQDYQEFAAHEAEVIAVGPENVSSFTDYWHNHDMPFPGIPDPQHKVANLYGQKVDLLKLGRMPAMFVIDKEGRIRFRHYGNSMSDIPSNKNILSLLDELKNEKK